MNDTKEPIEYIYAGEANDPQRKEKVIYPLHPARNEYRREKALFWLDPPIIDNYGHHERWLAIQ
ncbi:MAG: hypothetical protein NTV34_09065 [Proteobacteria bacterium]|nr:hypothetical protein [Pseudomonadota bacterium]